MSFPDFDAFLSTSPLYSSPTPSSSSCPSSSDDDQSHHSPTDVITRCHKVSPFSNGSSFPPSPLPVKRERLGFSYIEDSRPITIPRTMSSTDIADSTLDNKDLNIFQSAYSQMMTGHFEHNKIVYNTTPLKDGTGDFMQVFEVEHDQSILIKSYNSARLRDNESSLRKYMSHSMEQYEEARKLGLNVAAILNADPVHEGFCIVQRVPIAVDCLQWGRENIPFEKLSDNSQALLSQAKQFFNAFVQHSLALDLMPRNLRYERGEKGEIKLVLIDFRENPIGKPMLAGELKQALLAWGLDNSYILAYLMADFAKFNPKLNAQLMRLMDEQPTESSVQKDYRLCRPQLSKSQIITSSRKPPPAPTKPKAPARTFKYRQFSLDQLQDDDS